MKLLVVGDPHLSHKRLQRSQEFLDELSSIINSTEIDLTVILGDVFDEHEWVHVTCSTMWSRFLASINKDKNIVHILGNHEMVNANDYPSMHHALEPYKTRGNYYVVDRPTKIAEMGFVPYTPVGRFNEAINDLDTPLIFCHQEFIGSVAAEQGDKPPEGIQIISGHIHEAMNFGNVWYPGSPLQHSFGEDGDKYIYIIETDKNTYRVTQKLQLQLKTFETVNVNWNDTHMPLLLNPESAYYRFVVTAKRTEIAIFKASELYKQLLGIGKVKLTALPEERTEKKREGVTFRSALAELLKNEDLKEIADEIGA